MQPDQIEMTSTTRRLDSRAFLPPSGTDLDQPCIIRDVVDRVGDRWSLLVLAHLSDGVMRFNVLHRRIGDISKQVLSKTLKRLEADGFIHRFVHDTNPPQVEYRLTPVGVSFLGPMQTLFEWAHENQHHIASSRERYGNALERG